MTTEIDTRGCSSAWLDPDERSCPFFNGEWAMCKHPDAPPNNRVNSGPGSVSEQEEALHERNDWETPVFFPKWCPLQAQPALVRLVVK